MCHGYILIYSMFLKNMLIHNFCRELDEKIITMLTGAYNEYEDISHYQLVNHEDQKQPEAL